MKKIFFTIVATTVLAISLTAFINTPYSTLDGARKANKETTKQVQTNDTTNITSAYPCPCSNFVCGRCNGDLYWTAKAYKKYTGRKCTVCNGRKCKTCEYEGWEFYWQSGCKCSNCGSGFEQPDCR